MTTTISFNKEVEQKAKELMNTHLGKRSVSGLYSFLVLKLWNEENGKD